MALLPNLKVNSEDLHPFALVCGDPARAAKIAEKLDGVKKLASNREYHVYTGKYQNTPLTVASHGVGGPGAAVCFEELIKGGVDTIIRVGTAGSYSEAVPAGSLVISTAAVRADGLTHQLVPAGFPAAADHQITGKLIAAAEKFPQSVVNGMTLTLDMFYQGVLDFPHDTYKKAGVLAVEMENAALFVIAALRHVRAGAILAIDGFADADLIETYNPDKEAVKLAVEAEIDIALEALKQIKEENDSRNE